MDSPEKFLDVAALQTGLRTGAGERSPVDGGVAIPQPEVGDLRRRSSAASLLCLLGPIEPQLQHILNWVEPTPFSVTPDWIEFPLATPQFEELRNLEQHGYFCG